YKYYDPSKFIFELMLHVVDEFNNHYFVITTKVSMLDTTTEYQTLGKLVWQQELFEANNYCRIHLNETIEVVNNNFIKYITLDDLFESKVIVKGKLSELGLIESTNSVSFYHDNDSENHIKFTLGFKS